MRIKTLVMLVLLSGCSLTASRATGMHEALNVVTDIVDPVYGLSVTSCDARAQTIVDRTGTTEEDDRGDFERLQVICNSIFHSFETLRHVQAAARSAVELAREGNEDAMVEARDLLLQATEIWNEIKALLEDAGLIGVRD